MRYICFLIGLLFLIPFTLKAQLEKPAKIWLVNGVKIKGALIESFNDKNLNVELADGQNLVISYDHIKKLSFKDHGSLNRDFADRLKKPPSLQLKTFYHEFRGGLLIGEENTSGTIHTINGYQFNKYLGTGLGIGLNKFGNYLAVPIYATVKGYLLDRKVSPFYYGDVGYGIAWHNNKNDEIFDLENVTGGLYWQLGLGYQINFYNSAITVALGYVNQQSTADYTYYEWWSTDPIEISESRLLRRLNFSVGFLF